jgi:hypothetical protein
VTFPLNKLKAHVRIVEGSLEPSVLQTAELYLDQPTITKSRAAFKHAGIDLEHQLGRVSGDDDDSEACALMSLARLILSAANIPKTAASIIQLAHLGQALRESGKDFLRSEICMADLIATMITSSVTCPQPAAAASPMQRSSRSGGSSSGTGASERYVERAVQSQTGAFFFIDRVGNRNARIVIDDSSDSDTDDHVIIDDPDFDLVCRYVVREVLLELASAKLLRLSRFLEPVGNAQNRRSLSVRENELRESMLVAICNGIGGLNDGRTASAKVAASAFLSLRESDFSVHNSCSDFGLHVLGFMLSRAGVLNVGRLKCVKNFLRMEFYGWQRHDPSLTTGLIAMLPSHFEAVTAIDLDRFEVVQPQSSTSLYIETIDSMWQTLMALQPSNVVGVLAVDKIKAAATYAAAAASTGGAAAGSGSGAGGAQPPTSGLSAAAASHSGHVDADATKARVKKALQAILSDQPKRRFFAQMALKELDKDGCDADAIEISLGCPAMCIRGPNCPQLSSNTCVRVHDCSVARAMTPESMQPYVDRIKEARRSRSLSAKSASNSKSSASASQLSTKVSAGSGAVAPVVGPSKPSAASGASVSQVAASGSMKHKHAAVSSTQHPASTAAPISKSSRRQLVSGVIQAVAVESGGAGLTGQVRSLVKKHLHLAIQHAAEVATSTANRTSDVSVVESAIEQGNKSPKAGASSSKRRRNRKKQKSSQHVSASEQPQTLHLTQTAMASAAGAFAADSASARDSGKASDSAQTVVTSTNATGSGSHCASSAPPARPGHGHFWPPPLDFGSGYYWPGPPATYRQYAHLPPPSMAAGNYLPVGFSPAPASYSSAGHMPYHPNYPPPHLYSPAH